MSDLFDFDCPHGGKCCVPYSCEHCSNGQEGRCQGCEAKMLILSGMQEDKQEVSCELLIWEGN